MKKKIICIAIVTILLMTGFSTVSAIKTEIFKGTDEEKNIESHASIKTNGDSSSLVIVYLKRNGVPLTEDSAFWGNYAVVASRPGNKAEQFARAGNDPYTVGGVTITNCFWWYLEKDTEYLLVVNFMITHGNRLRKSDTDVTPENDVEEITLEWETSFSKSTITINPFIQIILDQFPLLQQLLNL